MFTNLYFDRELRNFLDVTANSKISMILLNASGILINQEGNFIVRDRNSIDMLSYYPTSKIPKEVPNLSLSLVDHYFKKEKNRVSIKVGRFIRKFLSEQSFRDFSISDKDIEVFVNLFKSYFTSNKDSLTIVDGDDIKKWYLEDNYSTSLGSRVGSLWKSCMRQAERNEFMELYSKNQDICKMLILLNDDGKLRARALLWENVVDTKTGIVYKVMDRIYSIYEQDVYLYKSWAKENGYISRLEQSAKNELLFDIDGDIREMILKINLKNFRFDHYPYLDTFKYFDIYKGEIINYYTINVQYKLVQSNGALEREEEVNNNEEEIDWED
jgi:hypothetical protein